LINEYRSSNFSTDFFDIIDGLISTNRKWCDPFTRRSKRGRTHAAENSLRDYDCNIGIWNGFKFLFPTVSCRRTEKSQANVTITYFMNWCVPINRLIPC